MGGVKEFVNTKNALNQHLLGIQNMKEKWGITNI